MIRDHICDPNKKRMDLMISSENNLSVTKLLVK